MRSKPTTPRRAASRHMPAKSNPVLAKHPRVTHCFSRPLRVIFCACPGGGRAAETAEVPRKVLRVIAVTISRSQEQECLYYCGVRGAAASAPSPAYDSFTLMTLFPLNVTKVIRPGGLP